MAEHSLRLILESLLFASGKPLSLKEMQRVLPDSTLSEITEALEALSSEYDRLNRGYLLKKVALGYQVRTRPEYSPYISRLLRRTSSHLSRAAMETLAIIAYRQPVIRQEIEQYRGVDVGGIVRTLLEKNLIRIMGRRQLPGRPLIYGTTRRFLEVFDLENLESLPKLKEIKELGIGETKATPVPAKDISPEASPKARPPIQSAPRKEAE